MQHILAQNQTEEILLAEILNKPRSFVLTRTKLKLSPGQQRKFSLAKKRLAQGRPLAYILGYQWFMHNKFMVNKHVLIPRPETEILVELAHESALKNPPQIICDVGTGSGAIIVSLADLLAGKRTAQTKTQLKFYASDISKKALAVARKNATKLAPRKKINFVHGSLLIPIVKVLKKTSGSKMIIANLPYLSKKELTEPTIRDEPKLALYGGENAHNKISNLIVQIAKLKLKNVSLFLEINYNQAKTIRQILKKELAGAIITIHKDLSGFDRVVQANW